MPQLTLYHCWTSSASQKVRLVLAEKQLPWESKHIDLRKQEHLTSDFRNINPLGLLPAIITEDGQALGNSTDIMLYLDEHYPQVSLMPKDEGTRNNIIATCRAHEELHHPHIRMLSYHHLFMNAKTRNTTDIEHVLELAKNHPSPERGDFLARATRNEFSDEELAKAEQTIHANLSALEQNLEQDYLFGDKYSIADAAVTATVFRVNKLGLLEKFSDLQKLKQWYLRMQQRESFEKAKIE